MSGKRTFGMRVFYLCIALILCNCLLGNNVAYGIVDAREILDNASYFTDTHDGFTVPLLTGDEWHNGDPQKKTYGKYSSYYSKESPAVIMNEFSISRVSMFCEDREAAMNCYASAQINGRDIVKEEVQIDGHPAVIAIYDFYGRNGFSQHCGVLFYVRQNRLLKIQLYTKHRFQEYVRLNDLPTITLDDMRKIAEQVSYDISQAPVREEDLAVTVTAEDGSQLLHAGKKIVLDASFVNPQKAVSEAEGVSSKTNLFSWYVIDTATGEKIDDVLFSKSNVVIEKSTRGDYGRAKSIPPSDHKTMTVSGRLNRVIYAEIVAESLTLHTKGRYPIILAPALKNITVSPEKMTFYAGSDETAEAKTILNPESIPLTGLEWKAAKDGIAEVIPGENGTATIKPISKGTVKVIVTEPGGKKATVTVNVIDPVEKIELSASGKSRPGGKVNIKATLLPKTAGVKDVEWSIDADESTAKINKNGVVTITREAQAGMVLTVTCRALGAPEPVIGQISITIE